MHSMIIQMQKQTQKKIFFFLFDSCLSECSALHRLYNSTALAIQEKNRKKQINCVHYQMKNTWPWNQIYAWGLQSAGVENFTHRVIALGSVRTGFYYNIRMCVCVLLRVYSVLCECVLYLVDDDCVGARNHSMFVGVFFSSLLLYYYQTHECIFTRNPFVNHLVHARRDTHTHRKSFLRQFAESTNNSIQFSVFFFFGWESFYKINVSICAYTHIDPIRLCVFSRTVWTSLWNSFYKWTMNGLKSN